MAFNLFLLKMRFSHFMSSIKEINFALSASFNYIYLPSSATSYWNNNPKVDYKNKSLITDGKIFFVCQGPKTTKENSSFFPLFDERWTKNAKRANNESIACILFREFNIIDLLSDTISIHFFFIFAPSYSASSWGRENVLLREVSDKAKIFYWVSLAGLRYWQISSCWRFHEMWNLIFFCELN